MRSISPGQLSGKLQAPSSKSLSIRALAAACLSSRTESAEPSRIYNLSNCDDVQACLAILPKLGAKAWQQDGALLVAKTAAEEGPLDCAESGLGMRLFAPLASACMSSVKLLGRGSLAKRPMQILQALEQLGVSVGNGAKPGEICLQGKLKAGELELSGAQTSQFLSGLLFALPLCEGLSRLKVTELKSKPYVELSLDILKQAGVHWQVSSDLSQFQISGPCHYQPLKLCIEADWSAAASLLVGAALAGEIQLYGLNLDSKQADRAVLKALQRAGVKYEAQSDWVKILGAELQPFEFDLSDCPDLFPSLACLAAACPGTSSLSGTARLKDKESDRLLAIQVEFEKLGILVQLNHDQVQIKGGTVRGDRLLDSHGDHRIAMSAALMGLIASAPLQIKNADCVSKSYPGFFEDLESLKR